MKKVADPDIFDKPLFPTPPEDAAEEDTHRIPLPFDQFRRFLQRDSFAGEGYGSSLMENQPKFDLGNFKAEMSGSPPVVEERVDAELLHPSGLGHYVDECTVKQCHDGEECTDT